MVTGLASSDEPPGQGDISDGTRLGSVCRACPALLLSQV